MNKDKMTQGEFEMSEKLSGYRENLKQGNARHMLDVAMANFLVEQIGAKRHLGDMFRTACRELRSRFPHRDDPENQWTEKRLKAWRYNESRTVKFSQMCELYETAEALKAARREHAEYIEKTARLRRLVELRSAHEDSAVVER
ncbi:hypothetical protein ACCZ74_12280 [Agrobacterium vitis]|uniref:hypothetical protein n=1 Tax=Agrobacterium vitis TaxID=373 RepID=UPI00403EE1C8